MKKSITMKRALGAFALAATALASAPATSLQASDIFSVSLEDSDGYIPGIQAGGKSLKDLLQDLVSNKGAFSDFAFANRFSGSLTYLGVADAIRIRANGDVYTVEIPSIQFVRTFGGGYGYGSSRDATYDEIETWLKNEGLETYSKFLKQMAKQSMIALSDGNPTATTARAASNVFYNLGFTPLEDLFAYNLTEPEDAAGKTGGDAGKTGKAAVVPLDFGATTYSGMGFHLGAGTFKSGDFKGTYADFDIPWKAHLGNENNRVDLAFNFNANYMDLDGAQVGGIGLTFALPIHILRPGPGERWKWSLTPVAGAQVRGSADMLDASVLWMAGGVSSLNFRVTNWFALSLVNQATLHKSIEVPYKDEDQSYNFDPEVSQLLLKNGLRASFRMASTALADVWVAETNFLKEAKVKNYTSVGADFRWLALNHWRLLIGVNADFGSGYQATSVVLRNEWNF